MPVTVIHGSHIVLGVVNTGSVCYSRRYIAFRASFQHYAACVCRANEHGEQKTRLSVFLYLSSNTAARRHRLLQWDNINKITCGSMYDTTSESCNYLRHRCCGDSYPACVCKQDISRRYWRIWTKLCGRVGYIFCREKNDWVLGVLGLILDPGSCTFLHPHPHPDTVSFFTFLNCEIENFRYLLADSDPRSESFFEFVIIAT